MSPFLSTMLPVPCRSCPDRLLTSGLWARAKLWQSCLRSAARCSQARDWQSRRQKICTSRPRRRTMMKRCDDLCGVLQLKLYLMICFLTSLQHTDFSNHRPRLVVALGLRDLGPCWPRAAYADLNHGFELSKALPAHKHAMLGSLLLQWY